jgi:hypothetical protein
MQLASKLVAPLLPVSDPRRPSATPPRTHRMPKPKFAPLLGVSEIELPPSSPS